MPVKFRLTIYCVWQANQSDFNKMAAILNECFIIANTNALWIYTPSALWVPIELLVLCYAI